MTDQEFAEAVERLAPKTARSISCHVDRTLYLPKGEQGFYENLYSVSIMMPGPGFEDDFTASALTPEKCIEKVRLHYKVAA